MNNTITNFRITNDSVIRIMLWAFLAYAVYFLRDLMLTLLVGLVIASTIDPIAKLMSNYKVPRVVTVSSIYIILISAVTLIIIFVIPSVADDLVRLLNNMPQILSKFTLFGKNMGLTGVSSYLNDLSKDVTSGQVLDLIKNSALGAQSALKTTGAVLGSVTNFLLILIFSFYLAVRENGIVNFLRLLTPKFYEEYVLDLWSRSEKKIGSWAKGQIFVGIIIGILVYIPLKIVGMPYASLFALLSFAGEMVPVVGLLLASIPAIISAYFTGDIGFALIIAAIFFVISQLENYVIYPKVMNSVIGVPAIIILIAFIIGAKVAGFWGVVLAVPLAAIFMEFINDILKEKIPSRNTVTTIKYD